MYRNLSLDLCTDSDVFYVERSSAECSPIRNNTPTILHSTELSGAMARKTITTSSVTSLEPQIVTKDSDSNEPTFPHGFNNHHPTVPHSLNDLNLPLLWLCFEQTNSTAPSHRSHLSRLQFRRPQ